ncbi:2-dehydropantoate 2-reductase [Vibrio sp. LaRot3]|uniref:2-dehydropantoate 2-reductase n=1 Tax=Vibrio sp. LaRot3 TaxID=2998829 RepID=UPI0022CE0594|nr:2-dehydropantoate 2-reductase [Vibrio sp. LaRot3]MDA0146791.1 2-dehydropantoate 2-reductase [Vibrio sp. LaRot3]
MNFAIVGPGAIGSLWATHLYQAGHKVNLWSRQTDNQLTIQCDSNPPVTLPNNHCQSLNDSDVVLVTLKAPFVVSALQGLVEHIHSDAIIVLMHNGMGTADQVSALLPNNPLLLATTTHGAYRPTPQQVLHTGEGNTQIGAANSLGQQCEFIVDVLNNALATVEWHSNIQQALWNKLAINCAINPLTAINNINNGELAQPTYKHELQNIIAEVVEVMKAEAIEVNKQTLTNTVQHVIEATSANYSSMQQDIAHQRMSEIDFITGYLIARAQHHQIDVSFNQSLYNSIKQIEQSW